MIQSPLLSTLRKQNSLVINSERLRVDIATPGTLYSGSRYDWTAFITQITLDDRVTFCAPEAIDGSGSGGIGLCSEFGIESAVGFDEAALGEHFVKPGVGLLERVDELPYDFARPYRITPFDVATELRDGEILFISEPKGCRGYSLRTMRTVRVESSDVIVESLIENVGSRRINTTEYCHNFIAINGRNPGKGTRLRLSESAPSINRCSGLQVTGSAIYWQQELTETFYAKFDGCFPSWWELVDTDLGVAVSEEVDFEPDGFALFATKRTTSPEIFIRIDLMPGKRCQWKRRFKFGTV